MHLVRSHRLVCIQVPQVVTNLMFSYSRKDFPYTTDTAISGVWGSMPQLPIHLILTVVQMMQHTSD